MKRRCFMCNGTSKICRVCGEAENVCKCEDGCDPEDCPDCEGTGIASADIEESDREGKA